MPTLGQHYTLQVCPQGHNKNITGRTKAGRCKICSVITVQRWQKKNPQRVKDQQHAYLENNKEKERARNKAYGAAHKSEKREYRLKQIYGISQLDYLEMFKNQHGKCAICQRDRQTMTRNLAVDHDHQTGKVRGLLCAKCNTRLETLENRKWNKAANSYLEVHSYPC